MHDCGVDILREWRSRLLLADAPPRPIDSPLPYRQPIPPIPLCFRPALQSPSSRHPSPAAAADILPSFVLCVPIGIISTHPSSECPEPFLIYRDSSFKGSRVTIIVLESLE